MFLCVTPGSYIDVYFCIRYLCICVYMKILHHNVVVRCPGCSIETSCVFGLHRVISQSFLVYAWGHLVHPIHPPPLLESAIQCVPEDKKTTIHHGWWGHLVHPLPFEKYNTVQFFEMHPN